MSFLNKILNLIFPSRCLGCNALGAYICDGCLPEIAPAENPEHDFIYSVFSYRDKIIKKAVHLLKYGGKYSIAMVLAKPMADKITEELAELSALENFKDPLVIPIPLSVKRLKERGYNQAEILAKELVKLNPGLTMLNNVLYKTKETQNQARIRDRSARLKNLKDCFAVHNAELIKNRNIILVDDVSTTGATLIEARKVLKKSDAKKIIALTLAH